MQLLSRYSRGESCLCPTRTFIRTQWTSAHVEDRNELMSKRRLVVPYAEKGEYAVMRRVQDGAYSEYTFGRSC